MTDTKDIYDFSDITDLPEDMQKALATAGSVEPPMVAEVVEIVVNAPRALTLKQVIAVAVRKGLEVPAETTVRAYVNRAAEDGRIVKVTRQTYWKPGSEVQADASEEEAVEEASADALADLG